MRRHMQYMARPIDQRAALMRALEDMPQYLEHELLALRPELVRLPAPDGTFSPVEQVWHLADLEREGFGSRIDKLRGLAVEAWDRSGHQEGVGKVSLCDLPAFMSQHDAAHRAEIAAWKSQLAL